MATSRAEIHPAQPIHIAMSSRSKAAAKEAVDDATDSATAVKPRRRRGRVAAEARAAASAKDGDDARKASRAVKFKTSFRYVKEGAGCCCCCCC